MVDRIDESTGSDRGTGAERTRTPVWQRYMIPALSVVAILAALTAYWAARNLGRVTGAPPPDVTVMELVDDEEPSPFEGFVVRPERPAPDFTLTDHTGQELSLSDLRGKAVLMFFGFTYCPDICPTTLYKLSQALYALGPEAGDVQVVFVSVDPDRDVPERIAAYMTGFDERFVGVTGDLETLLAVTQGYGVRFEKEYPEGADPETEYLVAHTATVFLIDPFGQLRVSFLGPYGPEEVAHDVRVLLAEAR